MALKILYGATGNTVGQILFSARAVSTKHNTTGFYKNDFVNTGIHVCQF